MCGSLLMEVDALRELRSQQIGVRIPLGRAGATPGVIAGLLLLLPAPVLWAQDPGAGSATAAGTGLTGGQSAGQSGLKSQVPAAVPQATPATVPPNADAAASLRASKPDPSVAPLDHNLGQYRGCPVASIEFRGVLFAPGDRLPSQLEQQAGVPLDPDKIRATTRRLFTTGRYRNIAVRVEPETAGVKLIFAGVPRFFVGRVEIHGVKEDRLTSLLEYGTKLDPGAPFTNAQVAAATESVKQVLAQNGFYEPVIAVKTTRDDAGQQVNVTYTVATGPQARIGDIVLVGKDPGITEAEFRKKGKLKRGSRVGRETTSTALANLRAVYQKKNRLEATVSLQKTTYLPQTRTLNYTFGVEQGPVVQVKVEGVKLSASRLHLLVPVFEEGTVDNDLLNEGQHNIKEYMQQQGYFDADVEVRQIRPNSGGQTVLYTVDKGNPHRVVSVSIKGNKYFTTDLLEERLRVQKSDAYARSGRFSQALVTADAGSIKSLYRANGFSAAKVTPEVNDTEDESGGLTGKVARISVTYTIDEGTQQTFGPVTLDGVDPSRKAAIEGMLNAKSGQPFSLITLSGDRDVVLGYYLSNGFDQARVEVKQTVEEADKSKTNVAFTVTEGEQVSIGRVLESGRNFTKQKVIDEQLEVHPGDPLDQSALLQTQRNLYNLALFNEVNAAIQNPAGDAEQKNVLVQLTEAKRWDVTYGAGFEAQTGTPGCGQYCTQQGTTKAQQGKAGVSPRASIDVSRINVFGKDNTLAFHGTYGLLEKIAVASFQNPHLYGSKKFALQLQGGYTNVQDITTFASSKLQGDVRLTQRASRRDTFIYDFQYRRVAVDPNSLAISSTLIPLLSQPVRVGGPAFTWFRDTRSPSPLDASKGTYLSVANFLASSAFGSQTSFNRTDMTFSTYYQFGKGNHKYVFARQTRFGAIASFGKNPNAPGQPGASVACSTAAALPTGTVNLLDTNASCNPVPLPERLYAGGATSHRGFPINGAGPRDLQTGFPVGGSGVFVNTLELRLPPPTLPYVGNNVSFVIFHDMGNVFQHVSDVFPSIARFHQPNEKTCENLTGPPVGGIRIGTCDFRYFSHAVGLGARYNTPVGPIRVDLAINVNPPKYPVFPQPTSNGTFLPGAVPNVGQGQRFNFFFSIGQSF